MFEMVQLWVNLPAKDKTAPPRYQGIVAKEIPTVALPGNGGSARIIAGDFEGTKGPAMTFTAIDLWDLRISGAGRSDLTLPDGHTTVLVVLHGALRVNGSEEVREAEVALFDRGGSTLCIEATQEATALLLCGEPINEPIVGHGPFVMNSNQEIQQAIVDYQSGKMGHLT